MTHLGFRIAGLALFGVDLAGESAATCDAATAVLKALFGVGTRPVTIPAWLPTPLNRSLKRHLATIDECVERITAKPLAAAAHPGLMSCPIHGNGNGAPTLRDGQDIRDQAITLLLAGHETTANVLAWTLALLAQHADEAERLRAQVANVSAHAAGAPDAVPDVRYALMEGMRLYPPVWLFERRAAVDTEIDGYAAPAGWFVAAVPWVLHRDPSIWPDPDSFVPARFLPDEVRTRDRHAFVPFGSGQRQCLGIHFAMAEMQIVLTMILKRFRFRLAPAARIEPEFKITLRPRYGVPLELEPR
jgi:cytochrome P450